MTKAKKAKFARAVKTYERKQMRKNRVEQHTDFLPIDTLYDPQACAEKLFCAFSLSSWQQRRRCSTMRNVNENICRFNDQTGLFVARF